MRGQGKKKGKNTTCRFTPRSQVTCLRMLNVFPTPCGLNFLRFYEHIAFHKAFHKHKNDISIFPYKWQICRKRKKKKKQDSLETVLYTPKEHERSPLLARTSVTHIHAPLEAKVNLPLPPLPGGAGAASRKSVFTFLDGLVKSTEPFSGVPYRFYFPSQWKKGENKRFLTGSEFTTYADCNKIGAKLIQGNPNHLAYR